MSVRTHNLLRIGQCPVRRAPRFGMFWGRGQRIRRQHDLHPGAAQRRTLGHRGGNPGSVRAHASAYFLRLQAGADRTWRLVWWGQRRYSGQWASAPRSRSWVIQDCRSRRSVPSIWSTWGLSRSRRRDSRDPRSASVSRCRRPGLGGRLHDARSHRQPAPREGGLHVQGGRLAGGSPTGSRRARARSHRRAHGRRGPPGERSDAAPAQRSHNQLAPRAGDRSGLCRARVHGRRPPRASAVYLRERRASDNQRLGIAQGRLAERLGPRGAPRSVHRSRGRPRWKYGSTWRPSGRCASSPRALNFDGPHRDRETPPSVTRSPEHRALAPLDSLAGRGVRRRRARGRLPPARRTRARRDSRASTPDTPTWCAAGTRRPSPPPVVTAAGRPALVLEILNTSERVELSPQRDDGGFTAEDVEGASHALRDPRNDEECEIDPRVLDLAYMVQTHFRAKTLRVVSAFRMPHGKSNHGKGRALDIIVPGTRDDELARFARTIGFVGVGLYPRSGFVHLDSRDRSYFWVDASAPGQRSHGAGVREAAASSDAKALAQARLAPPDGRAERRRGRIWCASADERRKR